MNKMVKMARADLAKRHGFTHEYRDPAPVDSVKAIVNFFDRYLK